MCPKQKEDILEIRKREADSKVIYPLPRILLNAEGQEYIATIAEEIEKLHESTPVRRIILENDVQEDVINAEPKTAILLLKTLAILGPFLTLTVVMTGKPEKLISNWTVIVLK